MIEFLSGLPMRLRYAASGFAGGFLWLVISLVLGFDIATAFGALGGLTVGGAVAGWLQRDTDRPS